MKAQDIAEFEAWAMRRGYSIEKFGCGTYADDRMPVALAVWREKSDDSRRLAWIEDMHTLHIGVRFLYAVMGYHLYVTHDSDDIAEYECHEPEASDLSDAWRRVIDKAAKEWANGKRIEAPTP